MERTDNPPLPPENFFWNAQQQTLSKCKEKLKYVELQGLKFMNSTFQKNVLLTSYKVVSI